MTKQEISFYDKPQVDALLDEKANVADLATVATTGSYDDLTDKPTIPPAAAWGNIAGTLSDQTDLQNALDTKFDKSGGELTGPITNCPSITSNNIMFLDWKLNTARPASQKLYQFVGIDADATTGWLKTRSASDVISDLLIDKKFEVLYAGASSITLNAGASTTLGYYTITNPEAGYVYVALGVSSGFKLDRSTYYSNMSPGSAFASYLIATNDSDSSKTYQCGDIVMRAKISTSSCYFIGSILNNGTALDNALANKQNNLNFTDHNGYYSIEV